MSKYVHDGYFNASRIHEVSQHTQILKDWSLSYHQLSSGYFHGNLNELWLEGIQMYQETLTPTIFQRGEGKGDSLCLGLFSNLSEQAIWMGKPLSGHEIISLYKGGEIMLRTPDQSSFLSLSIPLNLFEPEEIEHLQAGSNILIDSVLAAKFNDQLLSLLHSAFNHPLQLASKIARKQAKSELLGLGYDYLNTMRSHTEITKISTKKAQVVVKKALEIIDDNPNMTFCVEEICQLTHTSRRTVQNCFEQITGQSPAQFLKHLRLNSVRKTLATTQKNIAISDVATEWGFWHLSQFSADYKRLFNETPSQTLNANPLYIKHKPLVKKLILDRAC